MKNKAQGTIEYFIIFAMVLAAILASGFMERVRAGFEVYFNSAAERLK